MKILIIGYDAELTALTGKMLSRKGYNTICSTDSGEVLSLIERENIRLVIADIETDEAERLKICRLIKSTQKSPKILFVGRSSVEEIKALNAGADDWIKKPYKTAVFIARVAALMRQHETVLQK